MDRQINNLKDLMEERAKLKAEMEVNLMLMKSDIELIKSSFNPVKIALGFAKKLLFNNQKGIVNDSFRNMVGSFSYDKLLRFLPWPLRIASSYLLKNYVTNYLYSHKESLAQKAVGIFSLVKNMFSKNKQMAV